MTGFNIEKFKSGGLQLGGARPSLFSVELILPNIPGLDRSQGPRAEFLIKSAALPASTLGEIDVSYFGRKIKIAGDRTFDDWTVTILNDEDFKLRDTMENWSNYINTHISNRTGGTLSSPQVYKTDLIVKQYGKTGPASGTGIIRSYEIVGAFPTQISAITLDWDRNNTIEEFDVRFAYDYWQPGPVGGSYTWSPSLTDDGVSGNRP